MKPFQVVTAIFCHAIVATALIADQSDTWSKAVKSKADRGTLEARVENVRGDTGKWPDNDRIWVDKIERQGNRFTVVMH